MCRWPRGRVDSTCHDLEDERRARVAGLDEEPYVPPLRRGRGLAAWDGNMANIHVLMFHVIILFPCYSVLRMTTRIWLLRQGDHARLERI